MFLSTVDLAKHHYCTGAVKIGHNLPVAMSVAFIPYLLSRKLSTRVSEKGYFGSQVFPIVRLCISILISLNLLTIYIMKIETFDEILGNLYLDVSMSLISVKLDFLDFTSTSYF